MEPLARSVKVEEARAAGPLVSEAVGDIGRGGDERSHRRLRDLAVAPELVDHRPLDDVEGVRVAVMDVGFGASLAGLVARLGHGDRVDPDLHVKRPLRPIRDHLALAGP